MEESSFINIQMRCRKTNEEKIERGKQIANELASILRVLSDSEAGKLLGTGPMNDILRAILDPSKVKDYPSIAEFLLANKQRASLLALIRYAITRNYSFKGRKDGVEAFVSPHFVQWFQDGVMFLEGQEPFAGLIGLYRNKEARYAVAARDLRGGEEVSQPDIAFRSIEEFKASVKAIPPSQITDLERPIRDLRELLNKGETDESKYQELIQKYPWILGAQYESIQDHRKLDDKNIPDFTGVRIRDKNRDIIEIKSPFMTILRKDGELASEFNDAWNQAEKYLNFAREEKDYLCRKGLSFDRPRCYLIVGFRIPEHGLNRIRVKESMSPGIEVLTYDEFCMYVEKTVGFVRNLQNLAGASTSQALDRSAKDPNIEENGCA